MPGLGRIYAPDERDQKHLMRDYEGLAPAEVVTRTWQPGAVLNQGETPHCVGFGWRGHLNAEPNPESNGPDANALYYACKDLDGEPHAEDGSSVRSGASVCISDKLVDAQDPNATFLWAFDEASVRNWVLSHGPVVFGTNWYASMFNPDPHSAIVSVSGQVAGGHCYLCIGFDHFGFNKGVLDLYMFQNSWGDAWGEHGFFYMTAADVARLIGEQGEACTCVNIAPLAPVAPVSEADEDDDDEEESDSPKEPAKTKKGKKAAAKADKDSASADEHTDSADDERHDDSSSTENPDGKEETKTE